MPVIPYNNVDLDRIYHDSMNYGWGINSNIKYLQVMLSNFKSIFGYYYFNLTHLDTDVKEGSASLELRWKQTAGVANNYRVNCYMLHEGEMKISIDNNRVYLTVQ